MQKIQVDQEALALSRVYALLIKKAQEQHAQATAKATGSVTTSVDEEEFVDKHIRQDSISTKFTDDSTQK